MMTDVAIAGVTGVIRWKNSNLLANNRGHITLTKDWAQSFFG